MPFLACYLQSETVFIDGFTPLHVAGLKGYIEVVRELLNNGANVNTANKRGDTPTYIAGGNRRVEVVRQLLNHGANVNSAKYLHDSH
jgi:serine/threonine-protein phosphatase 6 regulatory ankyrin repeat subunit B